jgi:hypothetical protein
MYRAESVYGSAESAVQQSPGRKPRDRSEAKVKPWKGEADCIALTGHFPLDRISRGSRPGLCCLALSGPGAALIGSGFAGGY